MTLEQVVKRYYHIKEMRENRYSLRQIGRKFKITGERVRQICLLKEAPKRVFKEKSKLEKYLQKVHQSQGRNRAREMVRLRDKHTCQDCGFILKTTTVYNHNKKIKSLKGKIKSLDVHHIKGMCGKKSLAYDKVGDLSGMITLCHKCHYNRPEHRMKRKKVAIINKEAPKRAHKKYVTKKNV